MPLLVARAVALEDLLELRPVDRAEVVVAALLVPLEVRVGEGEAEGLRLRDADVDEAPAQFVVRMALDLPGHRLRGVRGLVVGRAEHHQRRPPPAVHRVLGHRVLLRGAAAEGEQQLVALALVEGLLLADADHGARVRAVGAAAQRDLVGDRGAVHQPADRADVRPGQGRVVEDRRVLLAAGVELVEQLFAAGAEGFGRAVQVEAVARLVLDLGHQDGLAAQGGRAGDPVGLRLHADDLGVGVLGHLAHQRRAVGVGHPVAWLDAFVGGHRGVEDALVRLVGADAALLPACPCVRAVWCAAAVAMRSPLT